MKPTIIVLLASLAVAACGADKPAETQAAAAAEAPMPAEAAPPTTTSTAPPAPVTTVTTASPAAAPKPVAPKPAAVTATTRPPAAPVTTTTLAPATTTTVAPAPTTTTTLAPAPAASCTFSVSDPVVGPDGKASRTATFMSNQPGQVFSMTVTGYNTGATARSSGKLVADPAGGGIFTFPVMSTSPSNGGVSGYFYKPDGYRMTDPACHFAS